MPLKVRIEAGPIATPNPSGVGRYAQLLVNALGETKDVSLKAMYFNFLNRQPDPTLPDTATREKNPLIPLRVYAKAQSHHLAPAFDVLLPKVDLTIFTNFATWPTIKSRLRATVVHDLTYIHYPETVEAGNLAHLRRVVPRTVQDSDIIITISEAVKNELMQTLSVPEDKIILTPIPPADIYFKAPNSDVRTKYAIPTKEYILFLGTMEPRKDADTLISAYLLLPKSVRRSTSLILAGGKGWGTEKTQKRLAALQAKGENVRHIGYIDQDDAPSLYRSAALYVMPSLYEGFGMPILEAMASKTPILASDIPVLKEVGGMVIRYASVGSPESFSVEMKDMLSTPRSVLIKGYKKNLSRFSWQQNVSRIVEKSNQLLEEY
jgi:glycosyltransferase involved in cell wall biosynthesis